MKNTLSVCGRLIATWALLLGSSTLAQSQERESVEPNRKLLFLTHAGYYRHTSLGPAESAVAELGVRGGFDVTTVEGFRQDAAELDLTFLTAAYLAQFDGLMMMTNGNLPLTKPQKEALIDFVKSGGGFIGAHCASLTLYDYPPFGEMLGAYFRRTVGQNRVVVLKVEDSTHPATRMLGPSWPLVDEFYQFGTAAWDPARPDENVDVLFDNRIPVGFSRDRVQVLLSIDLESTDLTDLPVTPGGDYPQAWSRTFGEGRSFYTALGHRDDIWTHDPVFRAHVLGGIRWALGLDE